MNKLGDSTKILLEQCQSDSERAGIMQYFNMATALRQQIILRALTNK